MRTLLYLVAIALLMWAASALALSLRPSDADAANADAVCGHCTEHTDHPHAIVWAINANIVLWIGGAR